jgi:hypothetical protein
MPETPTPATDLDTLLDRETRIDLAARLDAALDSDHATHTEAHRQVETLAPFLALAAEIRDSLHRPVLTPDERARIHALAVALAGHRARGLRRTWPQLAHLGTHPAVVGGAAAAVLAVVGITAALRDRRAAHAARPALGIA